MGRSEVPSEILLEALRLQEPLPTRWGGWMGGLMQFKGLCQCGSWDTRQPSVIQPVSRFPRTRCHQIPPNLAAAPEKGGSGIHPCTPCLPQRLLCPRPGPKTPGGLWVLREALLCPCHPAACFPMGPPDSIPAAVVGWTRCFQGPRSPSSQHPRVTAWCPRSARAAGLQCGWAPGCSGGVHCPPHTQAGTVVASACPLSLGLLPISLYNHERRVQ